MPGFRKCRPGSRLRLMMTAMAGLSLAGAVLGTTGCDDRVLKTGLSYDYFEGFLVDQPAPETSSPIRPLSGRNPDYPSLDTVPMRPAPVPTVSERKAALNDQQKAIDALDADRRAGHSIDEQLQEVAPPPLPVPPAPPGVGAPGPAGAQTATKPAKPPAGP